MATIIHPGFNPYTFVRANVMRSKLLKSEDYHKLLKMSVAEITKYLQDREYREDITSLGVHETGISLLDRALSDNIERSFRKLRRICDDELLPLIDAYMLRHDVWNAKTVLRSHRTGADKEEVERMLLITESGLTEEFLQRMLQAESYEQALKLLGQSQLGAAANHDDLIDVENALDHMYYDQLIALAESLGKDAALFRRYLITEVELQNIITVIRLIADGADEEVIRAQLVNIPVSRLNRLFDQLVTAQNVQEVVERCAKTAFKSNLDKGLEEYEQTGSLLEMERQMRKYLLRISQLLVHQDLLSFNTIVGYMLAKEYEAKNLRTITKGKALGIDTQFIEEELLVI